MFRKVKAWIRRKRTEIKAVTENQRGEFYVDKVIGMIVAVVLGGLLLALSLYLPATMAQDTLTLARCREMALENNKQMAIAEQNQEKASALVKAYRANFLPKISATGLAYYTGMDNDLQIPVGDVQLFDPTSLDGSIPPAMQPIYEQLLPVLNQFSPVSIPPIGLHVDLNNTYSAGENGQDRARTGRTEPPPGRGRSHRADR